MKDNKQIQIIANKEILGKEIKIYGTVDNPLFLAKDVAEWLEHSNVTKMLSGIDKTEKIVIKIPSNNSLVGLQSNTEYTFLTEDGLYEVFMLSRKPKAKQFKKEVKAILKQLRKVGIVMSNDVVEKLMKDPSFILSLLNQVKEYQEQIAKDKPKIEFYNLMIESNDSFDMKKSAKLLDFENIGRNRLYALLRENKILMKDNEPYQNYIERNWFKVKEELIEDKFITVVYVTNKGLQGIERLLRKLGYEPRLK